MLREWAPRTPGRDKRNKDKNGVDDGIPFKLFMAFDIGWPTLGDSQQLRVTPGPSRFLRSFSPPLTHSIDLLFIYSFICSLSFVVAHVFLCVFIVRRGPFVR